MHCNTSKFDPFLPEGSGFHSPFGLPGRPPARTAMATDAGACIICLDTSPPPIQSGCACRGDGGLAHVDCLVELAASQQAHLGKLAWKKC